MFGSSSRRPIGLPIGCEGYPGKEIGGLKPYQRRIAEMATTSNSIILLPGGAGHIEIAAQTITKFGFPALILFQTCYLVNKNCELLASLTGLHVHTLRGGEPLPEGFDIVISTPKSLEMAQKDPEKQRKLHWKNFAIVAFDGVHQLVKDHPYRKLAKELHESGARPRILGFTSQYSCSSRDDERDREELLNIGYDLNVQQALSATKEDLKDRELTPLEKMYLMPAIVIPKNPPLGVLEVKRRKPHMMVRLFLSRVIHNEATPLGASVLRCVLQLEQTFQTMEPLFLAPFAGQAPMKEWSYSSHRIAVQHLEEGGKSSQTLGLLANMLEYWYEALKVLIVTWEECDYISFLILRMAKCDDHRSFGMWPREMADYLKEFWKEMPKEYAKLSALKEALINNFDKFGESFRGIVLVEQRITTHCIKFFIEDDPILQELFKPTLSYATSSQASPSLVLNRQNAMENLDSFRSGMKNLLITTTVAEENMEIPSANCIIQFDPERPQRNGDKSSPAESRKNVQTPRERLGHLNTSENVKRGITHRTIGRCSIARRNVSRRSSSYAILYLDDFFEVRRNYPIRNTAFARKLEITFQTQNEQDGGVQEGREPWNDVRRIIGLEEDLRAKLVEEANKSEIGIIRKSRISGNIRYDIRNPSSEIHKIHQPSAGSAMQFPNRNIRRPEQHFLGQDRYFRNPPVTSPQSRSFRVVRQQVGTSSDPHQSGPRNYISLGRQVSPSQGGAHQPTRSGSASRGSQGRLMTRLIDEQDSLPRFPSRGNEKEVRRVNDQTKTANILDPTETRAEVSTNRMETLLESISSMQIGTGFEEIDRSGTVIPGARRGPNIVFLPTQGGTRNEHRCSSSMTNNSETRSEKRREQCMREIAALPFLTARFDTRTCILALLNFCSVTDVQIQLQRRYENRQHAVYLRYESCLRKVESTGRGGTRNAAEVDAAMDIVAQLRAQLLESPTNLG